MSRLICSAAVFLALAAAHASMIVGPWIPIFKGVERAIGTNIADTTIPRRQVVNAMRIDLTDPDVELFTDPHCASCALEALGNTTSGFLQTYQLQGAINYSFFPQCCSATPGTPMDAFGLLISQGNQVSPTWTPSDVDSRNGQTYFPVLLFATNNAPIFIPYNWPSTNLAGIYTAIAGSRPVLTNGVIVNTLPDVDPRTVVGISQDERYLILLTLDGRQPGYSDGANDIEVGIWLLRFGAYNAINVDGGGSATMVMADCAGKAIQLNRPIQGGVSGRERVVAGHLGFYAKPVPGFINDVSVDPGTTSATFTWTTLSNATTQVEYGSAINYGNLSTFDGTPVTNHTVVLNGLNTATRYYFRVISRTDTEEFSFASCFSTTNTPLFRAFDLAKVWRYSASNLDGILWQSPGYNDTNWPGGPGLLYIEDNSLVSPRNTPLPINPSTMYPYITYYFRTHFTLSNSPIGATLTFSNYLDDGAVFYLNGREIYRAFMPAVPNAISNSTLATNFNCTSGDATCPLVFTVSGGPLTNLVQGDNVMAVEAHNYRANSPDIVFGAALSYSLPPPPPPEPPFITNLVVTLGETQATIAWTTRSNATSQVEYGLTDSYGSSTPLDSMPSTNHSVTLSGLLELTNYYFRAIASTGATQYSVRGTFDTIPFYEEIFDLTSSWSYTTNNLDGVNWQVPGYDDSGWLGQGPALLYLENNPDVQPKNTPLPGTPGALPPTCYFRAHFQLTNNPAGFALLFSNYVDDGAVFYLNGVEIQRLRMPASPQAIGYTTLATSTPPFGDAIYADVFKVGGVLMTHLVVGDNVLAVEIHQDVPDSPDIVFGSSMGFVRASVSETSLGVTRSGNVFAIEWNGAGFTLQQTQELGNTNLWADVPGPVKTSPYSVTNPAATTFYRLRK